MPTDSNADRNKGKPTKHLAAISSLAVIAIILSPLTPMPHSGEQQKQQAEALDCASIGQDIGYVISGGRWKQSDGDVLEADSGTAVSFHLTAQEQQASESLVDKICSRPEFFHAMNATYDPPVNMVAYACEAASGTVGYNALKSLDDRYQEIYCLAAFQAIEFELQEMSESVGVMDSDLIPKAMKQFGNDTDKAGLLSEAKSAIANATESLLRAQQLLNSGFVYDAAIALDEGKSAVKAVFERQDMSILFGLQSKEG